MTRTKISTTMAVAAVALLGSAMPGAALQAEVAIMADAVKRETPPTKADRARELKEQAHALFSQPKQWRKAARLLEQSADLREPNDPEAFTCLMYAGRISAGVRDYMHARELIERAAHHALNRGAVDDAAHAFVDAALVAVELKDYEAAVVLVERAKLLANSPLLSAEQKKSLTARF